MSKLEAYTQFLAGKLDLGLLQQDSLWIPEEDRGEYLRKSLVMPTAERVEKPEHAVYAAWTANFECRVLVEPNFEVEAAIPLEDLNRKQRDDLVKMLWDKSGQVCHQLAWKNWEFSREFNPKTDQAFAEQEYWGKLSLYAEKRAQWFEQLPLIKALKS